ncbi:hypothetical protein BVI434_270022 [Burkholderia vietnamiensis]|nr:hypothetical protein BVI434_270022 [Burkholderia vietnamiensis]
MRGHGFGAALHNIHGLCIYIDGAQKNPAAWNAAGRNPPFSWHEDGVRQVYDGSLNC